MVLLGKNTFVVPYSLFCHFQHAVNFLKVAYMPPMVDIGPDPQHIRLVLSVTNHLGRTVTGICFNITVMPVDNQPPQVPSHPCDHLVEGEESVSVTVWLFHVSGRHQCADS